MFQSMKKNATKNVLEELLPLYFIIVLYKISCLHLWINKCVILRAALIWTG